MENISQIYSAVNLQNMGGICVKEDNRNKVMVQVEDFLLLSYGKKNIWEGLCTIFMNTRAKSFFIEFIYNRWEEILFSLRKCTDVTKLTREALPSMLDIVVFCNKDTSPFQLCLSKEIISRFQEFLKSENYKMWRSEEYYLATIRYHNFQLVSTTIPDILELGEFDISSQKLKSAVASIPILLDTARPIIDTVATSILVPDETPTAIELPPVLMDGMGSSGDTSTDVLATIDYLEVQRIMEYDMSLFLMLCAMENAPVSFTVATASRQRLGFPLIYANKHFETLTKYKRSEVIGRSAKFLQTDINDVRMCDDRASENLANCLRKGLPCLQKITNFRRNGEKYTCLVVLNPIFDTQGMYIYVTSLQFEIIDQVSLKHATRLGELFIDTMPDCIGTSCENCKISTSTLAEWKCDV